MILNCGEALIDMLPRETTAGEMAYAPFPGGAVFNTSVALGRLGIPTEFLSGISNDLFGEMLRKSLSDSNVGSDMAIKSDRPTTLAFVRLVDGQASYAFYDENTAGRMLSPDDLPELDDSFETIFFGGISLVVEPCGTFYEALMTREAPKRVTVIDPNIRVGFITDEPRYRARVERMIALADIVKLSDEDLHWLSGNDDLQAAAKDLIAKGSKVVFITEGSKGAHGFTREHSVFVASHKVDVVDTVGAGDTFNAGVMASLHRAKLLDKETLAALPKQAVIDALALGGQAAAVTVSRAGANPPWAHEL